MTQEQKKYLQNSREWYLSQLTDNILPFWLEHGMDKVNGGVYTCLDRDGSLMDTTKSVWFQGRCGYVYAFAYNNIKKDEKWLEASKSCIDFIEAHCIDSDGHMFFAVTEDGKPVRKRRYVFSESFAIIAMAEYAKATGNQAYAERALEIYRKLKWMVAEPGFLEPKGYMPGRGHSLTMILLNVALVLKQVCDEPELDEQITSSAADIEKYHMKEEFKCILESVGPNGEFIDTCDGRTINPGHGIETAWFLINAGRIMNRQHYIDLGVKVFDWQYEWGWDKEYGGIINFRDCRNLPPQDYSQDMKFWWPQCETVIASLYAYISTGDDKYLSIHKDALDWIKEHLVDNEYGEWYGYLHRDGTVAQPAKGNLFKGPFHIPRMLILAKGLCDTILQD